MMKVRTTIPIVGNEDTALFLDDYKSKIETSGLNYDKETKECDIQQML